MPGRARTWLEADDRARDTGGVLTREPRANGGAAAEVLRRSVDRDVVVCPDDLGHGVVLSVVGSSVSPGGSPAPSPEAQGELPDDGVAEGLAAGPVQAHLALRVGSMTTP